MGVLLGFAINGAPGWARVRRSFFDPHVAWRYLPDVATGLWLNVRLLFFCALGSLALGLAIALVRTLRPMVFFPLRLLAASYTYVFRGAPLIIVLYLFTFGVPRLRLQGTPSVLVLGGVALVITYGAYLAEVFRAGIESVHPSQRAAARSLGLTYGQTMRHVVLPQAIRRVTPPILNDLILLDGREISDPRVNADTVRQRIGIVFQSYNLFPHLSVLDNVTLAPRKVHGQSRVDAEHAELEWLARIGLRDKAKEYPDRLSGGQQQRVAIVRAIVNNPRLLLLDEVTSALDPELVGEVLTTIRELRAAGTTMLIATHEMGFARQVADRVCFLDGGAIVEEGPPQQVFDAPTLPRTRQFLQRIRDAGRA